MDNYTEFNSTVIDKWTEGGWEWGIPISHEVYEEAKCGKWDVDLSPNKNVPHSWFLPFLKEERLDGVKILGLACGGGHNKCRYSKPLVRIAPCWTIPRKCLTWRGLLPNGNDTQSTSFVQI